MASSQEEHVCSQCGKAYNHRERTLNGSQAATYCGIRKTKYCWRKETEDVTNDDMESMIQFYLESYKHYIIKCINSDDLLFYKHFSPEKKEEFRELSKTSKDCICVKSKMIDTIISMRNVPDKFSALVELFEDQFENEKVSRILKGEKTPTNRRENREKIQKLLTPDICKNLDVNEIIPYLKQHKLISEDEGMALRNVVYNEKRILAAFDLLFIVPHRHPNWYTRFLFCLIRSGHTDLAKLIDEEFSKKITQDLSTTKTQNGERPIDYHDEKMSLVSGSVRSHPKSLKVAEYTRQTTTNYKVKPTKTGTTRTTDVFPEHERVAEWVKASQDMGETPNNENTFSCKKEKRANFEEGQFLERTSSLRGERTLQRAKSKRHNTLHVPMKHIAALRTYMSPDAPSKTMTVYKRKASTITSTESSDSHLGKSFDADDTTEDLVENTTTKNEETIVHENALKLDGAFQPEAERKTSSCPSSEQLLTLPFMLPDKISELVKKYPDIHNKCKSLSWISQMSIDHRQYKDKDCKDYRLSLKAHYISTVIQKASEAENIDIWIENLKTCRESDGCFVYEDKLIREVLEKYEYKETWIFKAIMSDIQMLDTGDGLSSLGIVSRSLQRNSVSTGGTRTQHANKNTKATTGIACNTIDKAKKVKQSTCKSREYTLALNASCDRTCNDAKLETINENEIDQNEQMAASFTVTTESENHKTTTAIEDVHSKTGFCNTLRNAKQSTCNESKCVLKIEVRNSKQEKYDACNSIEEMGVKSFNPCETPVTKETNSKKKEIECANVNGHVADTESCGCFSRDEMNLLSNSGVRLEILPSASRDFKIAERKFKGRNVRIVCIHKISNENLRSRFTHQTEILKDNKQGNVQILFHGTKYLKAVIEEGFDIMCTEQGLGELYFSRDPLLFEEMNEFDQISDSNFSQRRYQRRILLCNVCLGHTKTETSTCQATKTDVETSPDCNSLRIKKFVNDKIYFKYKIFHRDQVCPEYLVTYETFDQESTNK